MQPLKIVIDPLESIGDWQLDEPFKDRVVIAGLPIFLCGLQAKNPLLGEVTGSAAHVGNHPMNTAWYELVERISILESLAKDRAHFAVKTLSGTDVIPPLARADIFPPNDPKHFQFSKSNGVALFSNWEEACRRASYELIERHLVLASWVGWIKPTISRSTVHSSPLEKLKKLYDVVRIEFGSQTVTAFPQPVFVSGVALMPRTAEAPLIVSFGAGMSSLESLAKAEAESIQRLGFLWGEEIPSVEPEFSPTNLFHQEHFLYPGNRFKLEAWLAGGLKTKHNLDRSTPLGLSFVDLGTYKHLGFHVAKAVSPEAIPLVFGRWRANAFKDIDEDFLIHPIA